MIIFSNIIAIFQKELQGYFLNPISYLFATVFWFLGGLFFVTLLLSPNGIVQSVAMQEQQGMPLPPIDVAYEFLKLFLGIMGSLVLFILPMLSMGLYAEERKLGTLELLATSPLTNWSVAVGKLLGVVTFFSVLLMPFVICEAIAFSSAQPAISLAIPLLAHAGLLLLVAAVLSLGMFISSLTNSALFAAMMTFALVLTLWLIDMIGDLMPGPIGEGLKYLSLLKHYNYFVEGVFNSGSLIVFFSYIFLGIMLTAQSVETFRFARR